MHAPKKSFPKINQPFKTRLRSLGHKLAMAEMHGSKCDLSKMQQAHKSMLRAFYQGRGK